MDAGYWWLIVGGGYVVGCIVSARLMYRYMPLPPNGPNREIAIELACEIALFWPVSAVIFGFWWLITVGNEPKRS